jgi:hypothetical protein
MMLPLPGPVARLWCRRGSESVARHLRLIPVDHPSLLASCELQDGDSASFTFEVCPGLGGWLGPGLRRLQIGAQFSPLYPR